MMSATGANKFGFAINRSRMIDYDSSDRKVREYITSREPSFRLCFACGGCTATCTAGQHTSFNSEADEYLHKKGGDRTPS